MSFARDERVALCDLLDETGPEAPTLCEGWRTLDLAAHLVLREHRPDAAAGVMGGPLAGHTERVQRTLITRNPYRQLVEEIRGGPPRRGRALAAGHPFAGHGTPGVSGPASKQVRSPVWQAPPVWSTLTSTASPSQSSAADTTRCT